jgi:hypothetical protein
LGILIDDKLLWKNHCDYVTNLCCQRIGVFKKLLPYLPNYVVPLYYNAFVKSSFSYCLMFWFNNDRSGRNKLIYKIDTLLSKLINRLHLCVNNNVFSNVWAVYKLQCLSFMHDVCNNNVSVPYFPMVLNNVIHSHNTRQSDNIHINAINSLDSHNFIYHCVLFWNQCPTEIRKLRKSLFLNTCKFSILCHMS